MNRILAARDGGPCLDAEKSVRLILLLRQQPRAIGLDIFLRFHSVEPGQSRISQSL